MKTSLVVLIAAFALVHFHSHDSTARPLVSAKPISFAKPIDFGKSAGFGKPIDFDKPFEFDKTDGWDRPSGCDRPDRFPKTTRYDAPFRYAVTNDCCGGDIVTVTGMVHIVISTDDSTIYRLREHGIDLIGTSPSGGTYRATETLSVISDLVDGGLNLEEHFRLTSRSGCTLTLIHRIRIVVGKDGVVKCDKETFNTLCGSAYSGDRD